MRDLAASLATRYQAEGKAKGNHHRASPQASSLTPPPKKNPPGVGVPSAGGKRTLRQFTQRHGWPTGQAVDYEPPPPPIEFATFVNVVLALVPTD